MKRTVVITLGVGCLVSLLCLCLMVVCSPSASRVDVRQIHLAVRDYARHLTAQGISLPPAVTLDELVRRGFLEREAVRGFDRIRVTISLREADETKPQAVLARATLPDGVDMVLLNDGSVQQVRR